MFRQLRSQHQAVTEYSQGTKNVHSIASHRVHTFCTLTIFCYGLMMVAWQPKHVALS